MNVIGFAGFSGSGKTTLVEQLIPALRQRGQRVSVVKHAHHKFDIDHPGKDTWRHRAAGAFEVVAASDKRLALMREFEQPCELSVHQLLAELYQGVDWVLVEGFKDSDLPKIEIWRGPTADYAARPVGYWASVVDGKTDPASFADAVRGTVTGTPSPESKQR